MGKRTLPGQNENEVCQLFDNRKKSARKKYRLFIEDGICQGRREELVGGGLRRSQTLSGSEGIEAYDDRILGSGKFVERLHHETQTSGAAKSAVSLEEVIQCISRIYSIEPASLWQGNKRKVLSDARGALCYVAVIKMGMNGASVARVLNVSRAGVSLASRRGEETFEASPALRDAVVTLLS